MQRIHHLDCYVDSHGVVRHDETNARILQSELDETSLHVAAMHVHMKLLTECNMRREMLTLPPDASDSTLPPPSVFVSDGWESKDNLLIIIGDKSGMLGVWRRDLLINDGIEHGSMVTVCLRAQRELFAVIIVHPFDTVAVANQLVKSPKDLVLYVWDNFIRRSSARRVSVLADLTGIEQVINLHQQRTQEVEARVKAIVCTDPHFDPGHCGRQTTQFFSQRMLGLVTSTPSTSSVSPLLTNCLSMETSAPTPDTPHALKGPGSTFNRCHDTAFDFILAAHLWGHSAPQFVASLNFKRSLAANNGIAPVPGSTPAMPAATQADVDQTQLIASFTYYSVTSDSTIVSPKDIDLINVLRSDGQDKVYLIRFQTTGDLYEMKVILAHSITSSAFANTSTSDIIVLESVDHPYITRFKFMFQTKNTLFLLSDYCANGELFQYQGPNGFPYNQAVVYAAELALALEHLQSLSPKCHHIEPEDILLHRDGHIRIADFGLSRLHIKDHAKLHGQSAEYLSPQTLLHGSCSATDCWWTYGVLLFKLLTGSTPFHDNDRESTIQRMVTPGYIPQAIGDKLPHTAASLIAGLLAHDPATRLGTRSPEEIRSHPFFAEVDWAAVRNKHHKPTWIPPADGSDANRTISGRVTEHPGFSPFPPFAYENPTTGGIGSSTSTSAFGFGGKPSTTEGFNFGQPTTAPQPTSASSFGSTASSPFGATTSSPFGTTTSSPFGSSTSSPFGSTTFPFGTTTTPPFGSTTSPFGSTTTPFGSSTTTGSTGSASGFSFSIPTRPSNGKPPESTGSASGFSFSTATQTGGASGFSFSIPTQSSGSTGGTNSSAFSFGSPSVAPNDGFLASKGSYGASSIWNDLTLASIRLDGKVLRRKCLLSQDSRSQVWHCVYNDHEVVGKQLDGALRTMGNAVEFASDLARIATLQHARLVKLDGVMWTHGLDIEAFTDFQSRGDLRSLLQSADGSTLTWEDDKCAIAIDVADALTYLHSVSPKVAGFGLDASRVLLDEHLRAKVNVVKLPHDKPLNNLVSQPLAETKLSDTDDVWSFGMLLVELDMKQPPELAMIQSNQEVVSFSPECPESIQRLAMDCLSPEPASRPNASSIAYRLRAIFKDDL